MADTQIGNVHGVVAVGTLDRKIGNVTADGVNTVTLNSVKGLSAGDTIDIIHRTTGAVLASARTVTNITNARVVTYDGADVAATTDHGVYLTRSAQTGFEDADALSISSMRARLNAIDATAYSSANLNTMTRNDMLYALRLHDAADTIN